MMIESYKGLNSINRKKGKRILTLGIISTILNGINICVSLIFLLLLLAIIVFFSAIMIFVGFIALFILIIPIILTILYVIGSIFNFIVSIINIRAGSEIKNGFRLKKNIRKVTIGTVIALIISISMVLLLSLMLVLSLQITFSINDPINIGIISIIILDLLISILLINTVTSVKSVDSRYEVKKPKKRRNLYSRNNIQDSNKSSNDVDLVSYSFSTIKDQRDEMERISKFSYSDQ